MKEFSNGLTADGLTAGNLIVIDPSVTCLNYQNCKEIPVELFYMIIRS